MLGRYLQKSKKQAKNVTKKEKEDGIIRACYQARRSFVIKDRPINCEGRLIFSTLDSCIKMRIVRMTCGPSIETRITGTLMNEII